MTENYIISASHRVQEVLSDLSPADGLTALTHAISELGLEDDYPREHIQIYSASKTIIELEDRKAKNE